MEKRKKGIIILTIALIFLTMVGTINAIPAPPECEIIEKPDFVNILCEGTRVTVSGLSGHTIEIIKSPPISSGKKNELER